MKEKAIVLKLINEARALSVNTVNAAGEVRHFIVSYTEENADIDLLERFQQIWSFGNVKVNKDGLLSAEYIVRPEEVNFFCMQVKKIFGGREKQRPLSFVLHFQSGLNEIIKFKISKIVRADDQLIWGENQVKIILKDCKNIEAIKKRIENILRNYKTNATLEIVGL